MDKAAKEQTIDYRSVIPSTEGQSELVSHRGAPTSELISEK